MKKNANPYVHKHAKKRRRITRKQWIAIISLVGVIAIVAGIFVSNYQQQKTLKKVI